MTERKLDPMPAEDPWALNSKSKHGEDVEKNAPRSASANTFILILQCRRLLSPSPLWDQYISVSIPKGCFCPVCLFIRNKSEKSPRATIYRGFVSDLLCFYISSTGEIGVL